jgi:ABC-type uncharacterized transport system auxiliary subunit
LILCLCAEELLALAVVYPNAEFVQWSEIRSEHASLLCQPALAQLLPRRAGFVSQSENAGSKRLRFRAPVRDRSVDGVVQALNEALAESLEQITRSLVPFLRKKQ